jgi:hypothetical protein
MANGLVIQKEFEQQLNAGFGCNNTLDHTLGNLILPYWF